MRVGTPPRHAADPEEGKRLPGEAEPLRGGISAGTPLRMNGRTALE